MTEAPPYPVLIKRGEFVDDSRGGRAVPFKLYYPGGEARGPWPVIIWSHGYGGNRDGAGYIARHVAGHGYAVMHLTHRGSDSSLWEGKKEHPWDVLRKIAISREMTLARFLDVPFALGSLQHWAQQNPDPGAHMDFTRLGMSGHSFGAMTTQAMAGQMFEGEDGRLRPYGDPRFQAGILYSPVPIKQLTHETPEPHIYGTINIPLFHMTGTRDDSPLEGFDYARRLVVHDFSGKADRYLMVLEGGDHMVYNGTRGQLEQNPLREPHETLIKDVSLAFWDYYLKGKKEAFARLEPYKTP